MGFLYCEGSWSLKSRTGETLVILYIWSVAEEAERWQDFHAGLKHARKYYVKATLLLVEK